MPRNKGGRCLFFFELWFTKKQTKQNNVFVYFYLIQVKQIQRVMVAFLGHFFPREVPAPNKLNLFGIDSIANVRFVKVRLYPGGIKKIRNGTVKWQTSVFYKNRPGGGFITSLKFNGIRNRRRNFVDGYTRFSEKKPIPINSPTTISFVI
jgi:hypothetical protein